MGAACGGHCECPVVKKPEFAYEQGCHVEYDDALRGFDGKEPGTRLDCRLRESLLLALSPQAPYEGPDGFIEAETGVGESDGDDEGYRAVARTTVGDVPDPRDGETDTEPEPYSRPRGKAVCCEPVTKGYFKEPYWNKQANWETQLFQSLSGCLIFRRFNAVELNKFVRAMVVHLRYKDEVLVQEGEPADGLFVVLEGTVACIGREGDDVVRRCGVGEVIDGQAVLWSMSRHFALLAQDDCTVGKLLRQDYVNLSTRNAFYRQEDRMGLLRRAKLLETMDSESLAKLAEVLHVRKFEEGDRIIIQGEIGHELFILTEGEASVTVRTADDEQEHMRYHPGSLFGEVALLTNQPRATTITAVNGPATVLYLHRRQFERLFGAMAQLQAHQYLRDPRKLIADFYDRGDIRGPRGSLRLHNLEPDSKLPETTWFAVYRPTSREAVAKMLSGMAVGKGLNVKGKSAKQGVLSGFVPFVQINDNKHKHLIEKSLLGERLAVFYRTEASRREARRALEAIFKDLDCVEAEGVAENNSYNESGSYGLELPETLLQEAYIMRQDLSPVMGWETGRRSEPAFMDANLHAIRCKTEPRVVLYQYDETDALNPRGLLIAYAERYVKPVVSDFDTFLIGSIGMHYEPLPMQQAKLVSWMLDHTANILRTQDHQAWMARWLRILKLEDAKGFHPDVPRFGFGDPTSYRLIQDVVAETEACGAIRHGAECSNFYFPQELDDEYLVVWHSFPDKPWSYKSEPDLRLFLLERIAEGYSFPLNPVWLVRDAGWYDVFRALRVSDSARGPLEAWFPPEAGILEKVEAMRKAHPHGFKPLCT